MRASQYAYALSRIIDDADDADDDDCIHSIARPLPISGHGWAMSSSCSSFVVVGRTLDGDDGGEDDGKEVEEDSDDAWIKSCLEENRNSDALKDTFLRNR